MTSGKVVRVLHTADWHLGARLGPCAELAALAGRERIDLMLHAGDLFDQAQPTHETVELAAETLQRITAAGAAVIVVAGNHDGAGLLNGLNTLCDPGPASSVRAGRTRLVTEPTRVVPHGANGSPVATVDCLPYLSAARAGDWLRQRGLPAPASYAERIRTIAQAALDSRVSGSLPPCLPDSATTRPPRRAAGSPCHFRYAEPGSRRTPGPRPILVWAPWVHRGRQRLAQPSSCTMHRRRYPAASTNRPSASTP